MIFKKQKAEIAQKKHFRLQAQIREDNKLKQEEKLQKIAHQRKNIERENIDKMEKLSIKLGLVKKEKNMDIVTDKAK